MRREVIQAIRADIAEERIRKALNLASQYGPTDGGHHKMWVIDQMVRALTGCPDVTVTKVPTQGEPYSYVKQGESDAYRDFAAGGGWDEGIAP